MIELDKELINEALEQKKPYFFYGKSCYLLIKKTRGEGYRLKKIATYANGNGLPWTRRGYFWKVTREQASEWLRKWADEGKLRVDSKEAYI